MNGQPPSSGGWGPGPQVEPQPSDWPQVAGVQVGVQQAGRPLHGVPQPSSAPQALPTQLGAQHPEPAPQAAPQPLSAPHSLPEQLGVQQPDPPVQGTPQPLSWPQSFPLQEPTQQASSDPLQSSSTPFPHTSPCGGTFWTQAPPQEYVPAAQIPGNPVAQG